MGVDPVMAQGADEDQLARIRPALMALPPLAAVLRVWARSHSSATGVLCLKL